MNHEIAKFVCGLLVGLASVPSFQATADETATAAESQAAETVPAASPIVWLEDYARAYEQAKARGCYLWIWFQQSDSPREAELHRLQEDDAVRSAAAAMVCVRLPHDARVPADANTPLLRHSAFAEMHGTPGLAIIDLTDEQGDYYREVVSIYPWTQRPLDARELLALLQLPAGSLTQRSLIFAVRAHPEGPLSASGTAHPQLMAEAARHATHQAAILLQGHHQWEQRFHQVNARLPSQLVAQEICAESWPGQTLLDAARDCVWSWRQSPGHWDAVRQPHPFFGYDMQRGRNGIWYATGVFGRRRGT